ncbi:hypothetical protein [Flavimaricola marinus]|uniref:Uncharacterized protein n=1 Tax=Flavimaricola marinus TaxID=1819565 RepID=A0A238LH47_9RHOB|nr:hypothetical protein [Flavimaricola marinus]SMY08715.1 hypothetical protein LOM8899_02871 [Flavimaricola marinus]
MGAVTTTAGIGHNNGPTMEPGHSWRKHVWTKARADLLPTLPIEVVRLRVKRAAELGLPYKTYASVRASTGHDVIGLLFSTNALDLLRANDRLEAEKAAKIAAIRNCDRVSLYYPGIAPDSLIPPCDAAAPAPAPWLSWSETRQQLVSALRSRGRPCGGYLIIGETGAEREWAAAGKTAGFLTGERFFNGAA